MIAPVSAKASAKPAAATVRVHGWKPDSNTVAAMRQQQHRPYSCVLERSCDGARNHKGRNKLGLFSWAG